MHGLARWRVGNDYDCVCLRTVMQWANGGDLRIAAAGGLIISGLGAVRAGAIVRTTVAAWRFVDVEIVV